MKRRFSVIIATYNREEYVRQAIDSVLSQTFTDYELIVVDDGSTDHTPEVLQSYGAQIKTIRQVNQGPGTAYKMGGLHASGEYLAFLDSDDLFMPWALAAYDKIIRMLDSPPLILGSITRFTEGQDVQTGGEDVDIIEVFKYRDYLSKDVGIGLAQSRIVMRKSVFEEVSGTAIPRFLNDYNLMLQAGTYGPCVIVRLPTTVAYRQHETQGSKNVERMIEGVFSLIRAVRRGQCSGGRTRCFAKYAFLGGPVCEWSRKALNSNRPGLAFRLLMNGGPMVAAAALRKFWFLFHPTATPLILPHE